jgi:hypothetical protein
MPRGPKLDLRRRLASQPEWPASVRVVDGACVVFALWTLCSHAVVWAGGTLSALTAVFALALLAALGLWAFWPWPPGPSPDVPPPTPRSRALWIVQGVGGALGLAAALAFHFFGNVRALWAAALLLLSAALLVFVLREPPAVEPARRSRALELGLWLLGLACAGVALVVHRPDLDDAFYVNLAVAAVDFPDRALLSGDTLHGAADLPLLLPVYRLHSYELWNGMLAWLSGREALEVFHFASAALAGLLVPLALARALRWLAPREWLWATLAVCFVLLAAGETHRWYGNFAFVRMWQGKAVYLFVFLPLIYAYALEFAVRRTPGAWLRLAAAQVAALGCSSSALWGAPAAALATLCCGVRPSRAGLRTFALGALSCAYVLAAGAAAKETMESSGHTPSPAKLEERYPGARLEEALAVTLGKERLLAFGVAAWLAGWAFCRRDLGQRFAVVVPLAVTAVLLNPLIGSWVVGNVTSSSYWRVMWVMPLPILMAFLLIAPLRLAQGRRSAWLASGATVALGAAFALLVPAYSALSERNVGSTGIPLRVQKPSLKVGEAALRWARLLNDSVPPGSAVLAPDYISVWVPTLHDPARPIEVRPSYLRMHRDALGTDDIELRHWMTLYTYGEADYPGVAADFRRALDRYDIQAVVLRRSPRLAEAREILRRAGFHSGPRDLIHEIWLRGRS